MHSEWQQTHTYLSQFYSNFWLLNACEIWPLPLIHVSDITVLFTFSLICYFFSV